MRCEPNDLAVIIFGEVTDPNMWVGTIVRVLEVVNGRYWTFDGPKLVHPVFGECTAVADHALRPIRDPGDDATDEMLQLLGKPNEVAV